MARFQTYTSRTLPRTRPAQDVQDVQQRYQAQRGVTQAATQLGMQAAQWYQDHQRKKDASALSDEVVNQQAELDRERIAIRENATVDPGTGEPVFTYGGEQYASVAEAELAAQQSYLDKRHEQVAQISDRQLRETAQESLNKEIQKFNENEAQRLMGEADFELTKKTGRAHVNLLRSGNFETAKTLLDEAEMDGRITAQERKVIEANGKRLVVDDLLEGYEVAMRAGTGDEYILDVMDDTSYPMAIRDEFASKANTWVKREQSAIARIEAEQAAQEAERNAGFTRQFYEDLYANRATVSKVEEAYERGVINDSQRGQYLAKINEYNVAQQQRFTNLAAVRTVVAQAGQYGSVAPTTENKNNFNEAYDMELEAAGEDAAMVAIDRGKSYTRAGIMPETYKHLLQTGMTANNAGTVSETSTLVYDLLTDNDTREIAAQQLPAATIAKATNIAKATRAGVNPVDALEAWNVKRDLEQMEDSPYLKEIQDDKDKLPKRDRYLSSMHSPGFFSRVFGGAEKFDIDKVPIGEREQAYSDFQVRYETFRLQGSSHDEAEELARLQSPYRATRINGTEEIAAYPLEAYHGPEAVKEWEANKPDGAILVHDPMLGGTEYPVLFQTEFGPQGRYDEEGRPLVFRPSPPDQERVAEEARKQEKTREQLLEERQARNRNRLPSGQQRRARRQSGQPDPEVERMARF